MSKYGQIILFKESRNTLCRKETAQLQKWIEKYKQLVSLGTRQANRDLDMEGTEGDNKYCRREDEIRYLNHRKGHQYTKRYLSELAYCLDCDRQSIDTFAAAIETGDD